MSRKTQNNIFILVVFIIIQSMVFGSMFFYKAKDKKNFRKNSADKQAENRRAADNQDWQRRYEQAQADLAEAEKALKSAQEIQEGDTVGSAYGGARPNAEWIERLEQAETDVELRRVELDKVKRQRR